MMVLALTFLVAYLALAGDHSSTIQSLMLPFGYIGTFIAGIFFSYGFTTAPATAALIIFAAHQNPLMTVLVGGIGALLGDLIIFRIIRHSIADEVSQLQKEPVVRTINQLVPSSIRYHFFVLLGCVIIASPLPDEIGVSMIASSQHISQSVFGALSIASNTVGIYGAILVSQFFL